MAIMDKKQTRVVSIGSVKIGGSAPPAIQSMTNTDTRDVAATVAQIKALEKAGCEIVRVAVPDHEAAEAIRDIKEQTSLPLVADIHFDHRLALASIASGVDKLRLNPGNIGSVQKVREVVSAAKDHHIPIRIGVNSGSLARWAVEKYGRTAKAMVESALEHVAILENLNFYDIVVSMKATDIALTLDSYSLFATKANYPLHLGITEAGTPWFGTIKSAAGLGAILSRGLGDTIRVSLTGDPAEEVKVAWAILRAMDLRQRGPLFLSCPTCGRTQVPLEKIALEVESRLENYPKAITIAVMGCAVNGPGEAREADIGIAGGNGVGLVFRKGEIVRKVAEHELVEALVAEAWKLLEEE